jgi:hypothetical protein
MASATPRSAAVPATSRFGLGCIAVILFGCLILQRFGIPITETSKVNLVTPIVALVVAATLLTGQATFVPGRLAVYCCLVAWTALGYAYTQQINRLPALRSSLPSLLHLLVLYLPFAVSLVRPLPRAEVFRVFQLFSIFLAVVGIIQFVVQFGGIAVFSFLPWMPEDFSVEPIFNVVIQIGNTGLYRSNGFFLVEPSVMSQMMALGIIVEMMTLRRLHMLALFGFALVLSVSGTGILVLMVFGICILSRPDILSPRLVGLGLVLGGILALIVFVVLEDVGRALVNRATEVNEERTSGYLRFVTPFLLLSSVFDLYPATAVFGLGPGASEKLDVGFSYALHTPWKILIEYGFPGMLLWLALVVYACWRRGEMPIVVPALFLYMFTGGYQQFGPIIFILYALFAFPPPTDRRAPIQARVAPQRTFTPPPRRW